MHANISNEEMRVALAHLEVLNSLRVFEGLSHGLWNAHYWRRTAHGHSIIEFLYMGTLDSMVTNLKTINTTCR